MSLARGPGSMAYAMEAAGTVALQRAGAILAERVAAAADESAP